MRAVHDRVEWLFRIGGIRNREHLLLDRALGGEIDDQDALGLTQPVHPANALFEYRGIPGKVHIDAGCRRMLQIQADAAGGRGQEYPGKRGRRESDPPGHHVARWVRHRETACSPSPASSAAECRFLTLSGGLQAVERSRLLKLMSQPCGKVPSEEVKSLSIRGRREFPGSAVQSGTLLHASARTAF